MFENDVKIYGIKTDPMRYGGTEEFENDVKIYGIKTITNQFNSYKEFENDVKIYGIKTPAETSKKRLCLRMM